MDIRLRHILYALPADHRQDIEFQDPRIFPIGAGFALRGDVRLEEIMRDIFEGTGFPSFTTQR